MTVVRYVERDGVRLACRDSGGPGTAVVLLHGLAGHAGEWDAVVAALGGRFRTVAVDQRGSGASERRPQDVSRAAYVADVLAVVGQLGLERPVLVGQSYGGHAAMLTAAAHPEAVSGLVVVEAGPAGSDPETLAGVAGWFDAWPEPFPSFESAVGFFGGGAVGEGWAAGLEQRDGGWWPRFDSGVMVESLAENSHRSWWDEWERIGCPVLAVVGQSGIIDAQQFDRMLGTRPETVAVSVPGTGHDLYLERPAELARLIGEFVR
ncbi:alpha/beta fold hydrolase [Kitasatospora hibisci]|uniref:alpha/beta fold hydrolase n=1 Tax=Kitasatospora hibisci TaxID=3369522 RepID=UPI0037547DD0